MSDEPSEVPGEPVPAVAAADWYPDPHGRHELRYWDGGTWSPHVSNGGVTSQDPVGQKRSLKSRFEAALTAGEQALTLGKDPGTDADKDRIKRQVEGSGRTGAGLNARVEGGGGSLFTEPILVVNQKAKIVELKNEFSVFDQDGNTIALVEQIGQSTAKKAMRMVSSLDQFLTHKMQITDPAGNVLLHLTRPRKIVKSSVVVSDADDQEIGRIVQKGAVGKIRFALEAHGETLGMIKAENWRAWNFRIEDGDGNEVARITKTWEGLMRTSFTTADNYVVQIHTRLPEPLNSLIVAAALSVDTALKQDDRGFN